jgi:ABC-type uncharacterized transport system permease subunit
LGFGSGGGVSVFPAAGTVAMNAEDQVLVALAIGVALGVVLAWVWAVACDWMDG